MKTLTTEQFNALPEEKKQYWKIKLFHPWTYTQVPIPLEDAERILKEAIDKFKKEYESAMSPYHATLDILDEALNNFKKLTNGQDNTSNQD